MTPPLLVPSLQGKEPYTRDAVERTDHRNSRMEIVTPQGEILTLNECQNTDLFWAMRGVRNWARGPTMHQRE